MNVILAMDEAGGIGFEGNLTWDVKAELAYFREQTAYSVLIIGRKTYESMGCLPKRQTIIVSKTLDQAAINKKNVFVKTSIDDALTFAKTLAFGGKIFIAGGAEIYAQTIPRCDRLYVSHIIGRFRCDSFVKIDFSRFELMYDVSHREFVTQIWRRKSFEEDQYLDLIRRILSKGEPRHDRTGTGTLAVFGATMRFNVGAAFPLLTTKKVSLKIVFAELMWFLRGNCSVKILEAQGVKIWSGWQNSDGEAPYTYPYNWRNFGGSTDQIAEAIRMIKEDPHSRRIVVCSWNAAEIKKSALPACHLVFQFYVSGNVLNCALYQRSGDVGLGVPYNIASYALLMHIMSKHCDLRPGEFFHTICDAHIYNNHIEGLKTQIERAPLVFPQLEIINKREKIEDYEFEDLRLHNYNHYPTIKLDVSI